MAVAPLQQALPDREYDKFTENTDGDTAVRVVGETSITDNTPPGYSKIKVTTVTIDDTQWFPLPPTADPLRKSVGLQNRSGAEVAIQGEDINPLTTPYADCWAILNNCEFFLDVEEDAVIYARAASGTRTVKVMELIK